MRLVAGEMQSAARQIESLAQQLAPVRTGYLRSTISADVKPDGRAILVRADAEYAGYVEKGTRNMDAQPYVAPAIKAVWPDTKRRVAELESATSTRVKASPRPKRGTRT